MSTTPGELMNEVNALTRERDELRAEVERLRAAIEQTWRPEVNALRAEIERLKRRDSYAMAGGQELVKEIERLRAEVESYRQTIRLSLGYRQAIAIQIEYDCDADD